MNENYWQLFAQVLTVLIVVFQSSRIWKLQQYLDASEAETKAWMGRAKKYLYLWDAAQEKCESLDNFPHEFAAKTAAVRSLKVNNADFQACQQRQLAANFGPQKSPSSGAAVRAQQWQLAAELEESE